MLRSWCQSNGFNNPRNLSHVLMDGGVLSIPFDKLRDFYEMYIKAVKSDEKVYVVEQKTETYNFFMDIDYKDDDPLSIETVKNISKIICDKVSTFGGTTALVSVAEPKEKDSQIKTGVHLNWPGLVVNQNGALQLMHHIVNTLEKIYSAKDWSKIIDSSVYGSIGTKGSGFRLPWSYKKSRHLECKGLGCSNCESGKQTEGMYLPLFEYKDGTLSQIDQEITIERLLLATVRTQEKTVVEIPEFVFLCQPVKKSFREGDFTKSETKNEVHDLEVLSLIETFIRRNIVGNEDTKVLALYKYGQQYLIKSTSRYCGNIKRNHSSNHVKLIICYDAKIGTAYIYQKCFCMCETTEGRVLGFCKNYSGCKHLLNMNEGPKIREILYPKKKK